MGDGLFQLPGLPPMARHGAEKAGKTFSDIFAGGLLRIVQNLRRFVDPSESNSYTRPQRSRFAPDQFLGGFLPQAFNIHRFARREVLQMADQLRATRQTGRAEMISLLPDDLRPARGTFFRHRKRRAALRAALLDPFEDFRDHVSTAVNRLIKA